MWDVSSQMMVEQELLLKVMLRIRKRHLLKLIMFFAKNQDMPFSVKLKVLNACFLSTILYGCESWLNVSLKPVEQLYCGSIKALLGVRSTTCNDLCLLELGMPSLQDYVNQKQRDFFQKLKNERVGRQDDFHFSLWRRIIRFWHLI